MRPEPVDRVYFRSKRSLPALLAIFFAFTVVHGGNCLAGQSTPASAAAAVYDSPSFLKELGRLKTGLENAGKSTETLHAYRESIPKTWSVDAAGRHYDVPTDLLTSRLEKAERLPALRTQQVEQAQDYLTALAAETASLSGKLPPADDAAHPKLAGILARSEFAHTQQQNWWEKIRARIDDLLFNAIARILRRVGGESSLGYILLWLAICATAVLIAYWIFRRWFRVARGEEMALHAAAAPSRSWQEWVFAAREAAGRGDYRTAIHCAYWAGIARLQDLGALAPDRAKTPREYLRALSKSKLVLPETLSTRQQALASLTSRFETIWYGDQMATETDFLDSLTQLENLGCRLP